MNLRKWGIMAVGLAFAWAGAAPAAAETVQLEHYGKVYARSVCGRMNVVNAMHCHAKVVTDSRGNIKDGKPDRLNPLAVPAGYGPSDLRDAYNITGSGSSSYTIAIVDAYGYTNAEADLAVYRSQYGLPACTTANGCFRKVDQRGGTSYPRMDVGWAQEQALDLDMASAMCPGCKILLVQSDNNSFTNIGAAVNRAATMGADAISNSYGGSESGTSSLESIYDKPGLAVTVSSGDAGYGVEFPAASPHVTAVGGTSLSVSGNARGWAETVWGGAGSGCSAVYSKPSWQNDAGCTRRTVADVSAVANPNTGVAVYGPVNRRNSSWMVFGGTSVSAPLIAGVYGVSGNAANYGSDPYGHASSLFDVTSGSNGSCGGSYLCTGGPGYDGPSGLGTPNSATAF
jgi:subtilase family serine protease